MAYKVRRILFCLGAGVLYYSGILPLWLLVRRWARGKEEVCVVGLHRILSEEQERHTNSLPGIVMRERTFAELLEYLERHFTVVSLDAFLDGRHEADSKPRCLLTFDDGWRDNFTTALPWLKKFALPAVIFAVTDLLGSADTFWVERLRAAWRDPQHREPIAARLKDALGFPRSRVSFEEVIEQLKHRAARERQAILGGAWAAAGSSAVEVVGDQMLTWEEAAALQNAGVEIEAHTASHPLLVYEDDQAVSHELTACKRILEERLKKKVRAFAYPNGTWDARVRRQVKVAGFECAFTVARGWHRRGEDAYTIRRIMLHEGKVTGLRGEFSPAVLALRLSGLI
jgi:peptidoglycan/xylan/chitin deacetylase (PgdA/CDA1 family)